MSDRGLRRGDVVQVRSAGEILATLDESGSLEALPFMPEMVSYCGREFTVAARAEKVCDTVTSNLQSRRLLDTVFLDDLRCDGSGHGGCQAECRYYWKEAWLRPVESSAPSTADDSDAARTVLLDRVNAGTLQSTDDGAKLYRCQATELVRASLSLSTNDPRPYFREYQVHNVTLRTFATVMARAAVMQPLHKLGRLPTPPVKGAGPKSPAYEPLDLQPGELVRVKPREEIAKMLTDKGTNRGLWFDREMLAFCGQVFRVRKRVERIIEEPTGRMLEFSNDCVILDGAVCSGQRSPGRWFCPREIFPYWRECWLERVDAP